MKIMLNETICLFDYSGFEQNKQTNTYNLKNTSLKLCFLFCLSLMLPLGVIGR